MGLFGMNESELKKFAEELTRQDTQLKNKAVDLDSQERILEQDLAALKKEREAFELEKAEFNTSSASTLNEIAAQKGKLEARRQELLKMEAEAKNKFVNDQNEAFREVFETRQKNLDEQKKILDSFIADAKERIKIAIEKEKENAKQEFDTCLANDVVHQHQENLVEAEKIRNEKEELSQKRNELKEYEESLRQREDSVRNAEQDRENGYAKERAILDAEIAERKEKCAKELQTLQNKCNEEISAKHAECNQLIAYQQQSAQAQYEKTVAEMVQFKESELKKIESEMAVVREQRLQAVTEAEKAERNRIRAEIEAERQAFDKDKSETENFLQIQRTELSKQKGTLLALESELAGQKQQLEQDVARLEKQEERNKKHFDHRNETIDDEVSEKVQDIKTSIESQLTNCRNENQRLLEQIRHQSDLIGAFEILKKQLGDQEPSDVIRRLNSQSDALRQLQEELATRPTEEMRERYEKLDGENQSLKQMVDELNQQIKNDSDAIKEVNGLRLKNADLEAKNQVLAQKSELFEGQANQAMAELERLRAAYERPAEVEARYKEIELPYLTGEKVSQPEKPDDPSSINELEWLSGISNACDEYGLHFNPRIVKAFHTALKTAEWSPLTVLAGVSGTGKSELPRLYSHFGGLFFEPLSVQPNWDSQESMLGFFNSIDNKFDAQPVLRFLAQSQKEWIGNGKADEGGYPGLKDAVCMVLLDEMNLAHPELYFAEFLSKLELRRGMKKTDIPSLPVKIGAGLKPYDLRLGRNVLWTGTMNQDETTKSLSDKVLDRSIIIHFPRPTELKRRLKLKQLDQKNRGKILHWATWGSWLMAGSSFSDSEVQPYKKFIEEMNNSLGVVGRAIGHRVWQSVEYYMANYPDVRAAKENGDKNALEQAMHIAFEDQLVQKVMPKLRGIDTEGDSLNNCLNKIQGQLQEGVNGQGFNLVADFELAKKLGYGQFMWQSANYLKETDTPNA